MQNRATMKTGCHFFPCFWFPIGTRNQRQKQKRHFYSCFWRHYWNDLKAQFAFSNKKSQQRQQRKLSLLIPPPIWWIAEVLSRSNIFFLQFSIACDLFSLIISWCQFTCLLFLLICYVSKIYIVICSPNLYIKRWNKISKPADYSSGFKSLKICIFYTAASAIITIAEIWYTYVNMARVFKCSATAPQKL